MKQQLCTFFLGDFYFGLPVEAVQEVLRTQEMTRVPLTPSVVGGLINLRGQIIVALDLRQRLELANEKNKEATRSIVVRTKEGPVSLLVDAIGDVIEVDEGSFEPPPDTLHGIGRTLIVGAYKLEGRLLLSLDTEKIAMISDSSAAATGSTIS